MDIYRMENEAKDRGFDSAEFFVSSPRGVFEAKWLDAYFGMFQIPADSEGFIMTKQLPTECEVFWTRGEAETHNEVAFANARRLLDFIERCDDETVSTEDQTGRTE